ncbi:MAG: hypothetical protein KGQ67_09040 [Betaproteobacteria bacterium]|nr:hypothetical protein [Betaproteobacteria bacterium]
MTETLTAAATTLSRLLDAVAVPLPTAGLALLAVLLGSAAVCEWRGRRLPEAVQLAGLLGGFGLACLRGGLPAGLDSLLGAAAGMALMVPALALALASADQSRLMAAIGLVAGPEQVPVLFGLGLAVALVAMLPALAGMLSRAWRPGLAGDAVADLRWGDGAAAGADRPRLPWALALAAATLLWAGIGV